MRAAYADGAMAFGSQPDGHCYRRPAIGSRPRSTVDDGSQL